MSAKRKFWNLRYALVLWLRTRTPIRTGLQCAESSDESYSDGDSPSQAVAIELEYWTE